MNIGKRFLAKKAGKVISYGKRNECRKVHRDEMC